MMRIVYDTLAKKIDSIIKMTIILSPYTVHRQDGLVRFITGQNC
jgi:hypothetical protein